MGLPGADRKNIRKPDLFLPGSLLRRKGIRLQWLHGFWESVGLESRKRWNGGCNRDSGDFSMNKLTKLPTSRQRDQ